MDKIEKALQRLRDREREAVREILTALARGDNNHLDIKKLKGREDIFRIRKGQLRIIYRVDAKGKVFLLNIERRSDTTYKLHD